MAKTRARRFPVILFLCVVVFTGSFLLGGMLFLLPQRVALIEQWNEQNYQSAITLADEILLAHPLDENALLIRGFSSFMLGRYQPDQEAAREYLHSAVQNLRRVLIFPSPPRKTELLSVLGKAYFHLQRYPESRYYLEEAKNNNLVQSDVYDYLALLYESQNQNDELIAMLEMVVKIHPKDVYYVKLSHAYLRNEEYVRAMKLFQYLADHSTDPIFQETGKAGMAEVFLQQNDLVAAQRTLEEVLETNAESDQAHYLLGNVYEKRQEMEHARFEWREAVRINPRNATAIAKLEK